MVPFSIGKRLTLSPAVIVAASLGVAAGAATFLIPTALLESAVLNSGLAAFISAAEPPLGMTARCALAVAAAVAAGGIGWLTTSFLPTPRTRKLDVGALADVLPVLRLGEAHPDAPAREPLMATRDLGMPFLDVKASTDMTKTVVSKPKPAPAAKSPYPETDAFFAEAPRRKLPPAPPVERALPRDLDAPLSDYDPDAIPEMPAEPVPTVESLVKPQPELNPGERLEVFELQRPAPLPVEERPIATPRTDATIHALLERLERGVARRVEPVVQDNPVAEVVPQPEPEPEPVHRLEDTLTELRRLAMR